MQTSPAVDPCRCPLCGRPNHCAMEASGAAKTPGPCWCTRVHMSAALLQRLPEQARGKACICEACARQED